jgi:hypothetical protein
MTQATAEAPAETPAAEAAKPRRSRRALAAKIAGIAGIVVCAVIILGVWLGRGAVANALDGLSSDVSAGFDRAIKATDAVAGRLDEAASSIDGINKDAIQLAASTSPAADKVASLQARLAQVADTYRQFRAGYAEIRENVVTASVRVQQVARLIPGDRIPENAGDRLRAVDDKLTEIDDALTSTFAGIGTASGPAAQAIATQTARVKAAMTAGAAAVDGMSDRLTSAQSDANDALNGIQTLLLIATLAISLLLLWVLLLNVALWLLGKAWQREADAGVEKV